MPFAASSLDLECPIDFTEPQKAALSNECPLKSDAPEGPDEFVVRRYLETLWLPESLLQLTYLIYSLRRLSSDEIIKHVAPLLKTARTTQDKYHKELPQILHDGGGAGEIEESVMWYAWSNEKVDSDMENDEAKEAVWRKKWLDRLEKRETQIQVLLHMLILTCPTTPKIPPQSSSPRKSSAASSPRKRRRYEIEEEEPEPTLEDQLEYLMDKLSVWQLVDSMDTVHADTHINDWAQEFCVKIVEPLFGKVLPEQCELLRTKVFPQESIPDSPDSDLPRPMKRAPSRALSRAPSLPPSRALSREPSLPPQSRSLTREKSTGDLFGAGVSLSRSRSRSRSRSHSFVEDTEDVNPKKSRSPLSRGRSIVEDGKPNARASIRTGVNTAKNPYEVTFRRSLSKPTLELANTKPVNPVITRARSPPRDAKKRVSSTSVSAASQEIRMAPITLALETPPRGQSQPISRRDTFLSQSPPDPIDFFKTEDDSNMVEILAMETPVKLRRGE